MKRKNFKRIFITIMLFVLICLPLTGCKKNNEEALQPQEENMNTNPKILITLTDGRTIRLELYPEIAPVTVENFLKLVDSGFYTNTIFHRIIYGFMIQTGWFENQNNTLSYKPETDTIVGEFSNNGYTKNTLKHTLGVISMARATEYDTASGQFFICSETRPHLDGDYAAFGKTLDKASNEVVVDISGTPTGKFSGMSDFPYSLTNVTIAAITRIIE